MSQKCANGGLFFELKEQEKGLTFSAKFFIALHLNNHFALKCAVPAQSVSHYVSNHIQ